MSRPLFIISVLTVVLIISTITVVVSGCLILMEMITTGIISEFAAGYALGLATPFIVGLWILRGFWKSPTPRSAFNSSLDSALAACESTL